MAVMTGIDLATPGLTVARAALTAPKLLDERATVGDVHRFFADDHVHAALVVDRAGVLLSVVERADLLDAVDSAVAADTALPGSVLGRLDGRTVGGEESLSTVVADMRASRRRRLAVVDRAGHLLGLLCMKQDFSGFCSDADVLARAQERGPV